MRLHFCATDVQARALAGGIVKKYELIYSLIRLNPVLRAPSLQVPVAQKR
jgi:hypothetical protein